MTVASLPETNKFSLNKLMMRVADDLTKVDQIITARMHSHVPLIPELANHLIGGGGKRIRPILTLACADMFEYKGEDHCKMGACVEFIHTATLLHDDVVDGSTMRRGRQTANMIWGNQESVLVGDFLLARAFELALESHDLRILSILSRATTVIVEGEVEQLSALGQVDLGEERYLGIIESKTATLFAAACELAGVVCDRSADEQGRLASLGRNLGMAFQLADDAMDYASDDAVMGKCRGDDFREGKVTLPLIVAYRAGSPDERAFWQGVVGGETPPEGDALDEALTLIRKYGGLDATLDLAHCYGAKALADLSSFPDSPARQALEESVAFMIQRSH